jgi:hypothetical protein
MLLKHQITIKHHTPQLARNKTKKIQSQPFTSPFPITINYQKLCHVLLSTIDILYHQVKVSSPHFTS